MRSSRIVIALATFALLACAGDGTTTQEMEAAAIDRARLDLGVPADVPLQAQVWTGGEWEGDTVLCGMVSGGELSQRFAATAEDPPQWLIWEDARTPTPPSQPDKFPNWAETCAGSAPGRSRTS